MNLVLLSLLTAVALTAQDRPRVRPVPDAGRNMQTGPRIGERIPAFTLKDQSGREQTFESLRGPNGLVLAFVRSADW
ncbi:MAG: hypothetical protein IT168_01275 [Bryobacterales bacterium]|nr:hypothetical protein [Bryobacterales bacterium]